MRNVHIGTCSWADTTMVKTWYPASVSTPEARLRYYAGRFTCVEADAPFYAIPSPETTARWAERTPPDFIFHVKAFGMLTGHVVPFARLPLDLKVLAAGAVQQEYVRQPSDRLLAAAFAAFSDSLAPLRGLGKLGGVLLQFPSRFTARDARELSGRLGYLDMCRERLSDHLLVEFRHPSWVEPGVLPEVLRFLSERDMSIVDVDAPQFPDRSTMPPLALATSETGYVRFHGRNAATFFARAGSAAERFDYLYTPEELREWEPRVREIAAETKITYVMFNNCRYDFAPRNAAEMATILDDIVVPPESDHPGPAQQDTLF